MDELKQEFLWNLFADEASSLARSGAGILLKGPYNFKVCYAMQFDFLASSNMAEYEALINDMQTTMVVRVSDLQVSSDSQLVINQIKGVYQAKDSIIQKYLARMKALKKELNEQGVVIRYRQISRSESEEADLLSKLSMEELAQLPDEVYVEQVGHLSFEKSSLVM